MFRKLAALVAVAVLTLTLAPAAFAGIPRPVSDTYFYDFSKTLTPWQAASATLPVGDHSLVLKSEELGNIGINTYAALATPQPGEVWMVTYFPTKGTSNHVRVTFTGKNFGDSKWIVPLVYVGNEKPVTITQFQRAGLTFTRTWEQYSVEIPVKGDLVFVAIGYKGYGPSWGGFDDVLIETLAK